MKETRKQKEIRLRRDIIFNGHESTNLSTTDYIDKISKKLKISSVTAYSDLKAKRLQNEIESYIMIKGYSWSYQEIMKQYYSHLKGEYVSHTAKDVINKVIKPNLTNPKHK